MDNPDSILPDALQTQLRSWSLNKKVIVELGSCPGRSSESLLLHSGATLFMVDPKPSAGLSKQKLEARLKHHFDAGRAFMLDMESSAAFHLLTKVLAHRHADMVFMDANQSPFQLEMDIFNYTWLLATGGLICGRFTDKTAYVAVLDKVLPEWKLDNNLWWKVMA